MAARWKCPKCGRTFAKKNQQHSCIVYPLEAHFKGRPSAIKKLYKKLVSDMKKTLGPFHVDSVECCIHFVSSYAFSGLYILTDKIRISFVLKEKIKSPRLKKHLQISAHRHAYEVEIGKEKDVDAELISWLKEAYKIGKK